MYELKKMERHLRVNLLGPGPFHIKKKLYRTAVSQRLRNTVLDHLLMQAGVCQNSPNQLLGTSNDMGLNSSKRGVANSTTMYGNSNVCSLKRKRHQKKLRK